MICYENLTKKYGRFTAVDDLSFKVAPKEAVALWGPNGAGKTTVIKCLLGLLRYEGQITVDGLDARRDGRRARRAIGYVPQELAFYDDLGTLDTVRFYSRLKEVPTTGASESLALVGLADHGDKPVGALSGGMKQRLALALALLANPLVLVLDEPTSNLDAAARDQFLDLLSEVRSGGKTVLFTSHRLEETEALADHVLVMEDGRLALKCAADELATRLGLHSRVRLSLPDDLLAEALEVLKAEGFAVHRNGAGLLVEVPAGEKARPITVLAGADIRVIDLEVE